MRGIVRALQMIALVSGYVSGPIFLFVPLGWWLYLQLGNHLWLYGSVVLAFVSTITLSLWVLPKKLTKFLKDNPS